MHSEDLLARREDFLMERDNVHIPHLRYVTALPSMRSTLRNLYYRSKHLFAPLLHPFMTVEATLRPAKAPVAVVRHVRVSVVIATYQGERFLKAQLESILAQTVPVDEIILVDDCSCDSTLEVANAIRARSSVPMRVVPNARNMGISRNFERGLRMAQGDIVFLADQDDVWRRDKVERMLDEFEHRPALHALFTNARLINDHGSSIHGQLFPALHISEYERRMVRQGRAFDALIRRNLATGATMALRRDAIHRALPIPDDWLHDEWLAVITAAYGQIDFIADELIDYRQHDSNQIGATHTLLSAFKKMLQSRGDFHRKLARRTKALHYKLRSMSPPIAIDRLAVVQGKLRHAERRSNLPPNHLVRLPVIWREVMNGGYLHYSSGWRSVVRDLLEPIRNDLPVHSPDTFEPR